MTILAQSQLPPRFNKIYYHGQGSGIGTVIEFYGSSLLPLSLNGSNRYLLKVDNILSANSSTEKLKTTHYYSVTGDLPVVNDGNMGFVYPKVDNQFDFGPIEYKTEFYKYNSQTDSYTLAEGRSPQVQ